MSTHQIKLRKLKMLTFQDCADYCNLSDDEIQAIMNGANVTPMEACAMAQEYADSPEECRKMLSYLLEYMEKEEARADAHRCHEIHNAVNHFASNHHFV
jgi:hypothetical protein